MGIKTFLMERRERKELEKAIETGKELAEAGVTEATLRTTTGEFVTPTGEVSITPTGEVIKRVSGGRLVSGPLPAETTLEQEKVFRETGAPVPTPTAKTIASQIGVAPTPTEQALALGTGVRPPSPKFDVKLFKKAGRELFFVDGTPIQAAGTLASPLQRFFQKKKGEEEFVVPSFGTIQVDPITGEKVPVEVTTGIEEIRKEALLDPSLLIPSGVLTVIESEKIQKELISKLQPKVTSGEISIEEAEKEFEKEFGTRFETEVLPSIKKGERFRRKFEAGEEPIIDVKKIAELGAIGLGGLTPVGVSLVGTSFVGRGIPKLGEGLLGEDLKLTQRGKLLGLGTLEVGLGILGGGLAVRQAERLIDIAFLKELQAQKGFVTGEEVARFEEGALFDIKSLRQLGTGRIKTELKTPVFQTAEGRFSITGGRGRTTLDFFSIEKGRRVKLFEEFGFGGRQFVSKEVPKIVSKEFSVGLEETTGAFGKGFIQRRGKETFTEFGFGGISRDVETQLGKITQVQAGKLRGLRFGDPFRTLKIKSAKRFETERLIFRERIGKIKIEERGIIKRLESKEGESLGLISPAKIKKTPFQTTFQRLDITPPTGITTAIEKQLFKPSQIIKDIPKVSRGLVGIPRAVGGEGLTEQQLIQERGLVQPAFVQRDLISTRQIGRGQLRFETGLVSRQIPKQLQVPTTGLAEAQVSRFKTGLVSRQILAPKQILPPTLTPPKFRIPFEPIGGFGLPPIIPLFPRLGGIGERKKPKKRKKARARVAPSFTGIVLGIEEAAFIDPILGVLPGEIRGLETGFEFPKRKKKGKKK